MSPDFLMDGRQDVWDKIAVRLLELLEQVLYDQGWGITGGIL